MPAHVEIGVGFDGDAYVKRLQESGVDGIAVFAKCHYGHNYYPSKYGTNHPKLRTDMLGEVKRGCELHGVRMIVYYTVFLDTMAVVNHPDWRTRSPKETIDAGFSSSNYEPVCVNSPYLEELLVPHTREIIERYHPDEIFFDTMTGFHPCGCDHCRKAWGKPIPLEPEDADWLDYVRWYKGRFDAFFRRAADAARAADPNIDVEINWEWGVRNPEEPPQNATRLGADLIPTPRVASTLSRYFAGTGRPFDYMTGRFLHGLGDWNNNTKETILLTAVSTVSNGGSFYIIDRQLPNGSLEERAWRMMRDVFGFLQERRSVFEGTHHVPEIAVLHSYDHIMGDCLQYYPLAEVRNKRREPFEGVSRLCMVSGRHYTAYSLENLLARLDEHQLVIVPETEYLTDAVVARLETYVRNGGNLLLTFPETLEHVPDTLLQLAGVAEDTADRRLPYAYIEVAEDEPINARTSFLPIQVREDAEIRRARIEPEGLGDDGKSYGHGFAPPGQPDGYAATSIKRHGLGRVITWGCGAFACYGAFINPWLGRMLIEDIDALTEPLGRVHTRAQVELVCVRKDSDLIIHLVNHSGREFLSGYYYPVVEYIPVLSGLTVSLSRQLAGRPIKVHSSGETVIPEARDGRLWLDGLQLHIHEALVVTGFFNQ